MSSANVTTSIDGIIRRINLSESNYLFPLFETVVNSIQAIEEAKEINGEIIIYIKREKSKQVNTNNTLEKFAPIHSIEVVDNGIGFTASNYKSFKEYYTIYKAQLGCKGVGRFLSLAAFNKVDIESVYYNSDTKSYYKRELLFSKKEGVKEISNKEVNSDKKKTKVVLSKYLDKYIKAPQTITIAEKLLEHLLVYFITASNPKIQIYDDDNPEVIDLQKVFEEEYFPDDDIDQIKLANNSLDVLYVKTLAKKNSQHKVHFCGHKREVNTIPIHNIIPAFFKPIVENEQSYNLSIYVKGELLDDNIDDFRNKITIPNTIAEKGITDLVSFEEINTQIASKLIDKYPEFINENEEEKKEEIKTYIYSNRRYEYMHLLEYPELISKIPHSLNDKDKDYHLHKINYELEKQQKALLNEFLANKDQYKSSDEYKEAFEGLLNYENNSGKSKLANYMVHRKAVLLLFDRFIEQQKNDEYKLEEDIHNILFTKKKDKPEIAFNDHNLWLLDERIAFSKYLSSDKGFNEIEMLNNTSEKAADLFIYDSKFTYGEHKESIVIFEFKRPMRNYYSKEEKDLGNQIMLYVDDLMKPTAKNKNGRPLMISKNTPKFGYIICDYHHSKDHIDFLESRGYKRTPKDSLFKYEEGVNLFIEILTYDQLLEDANLRHKAFFNSLGI